MSKKRVQIVLISAVALASLFFLLEKNILTGFSSKSSPPKDLRILETVINLVKNHYIEEPDPSKTMKGAFKGLVDSLDILSSYLDRESAIKYGLQKENRLKETGIILYKRYGTFPQVIGIIKDSPAEKNKIRIGDVISSIDSQETLDMSMLEVSLQLKDEEGKPADLKIIRRDETKKLKIERKRLFEEPMSFSHQEETSGLLKIHHLYPSCVGKTKKEVVPLLKGEEKTLILDLRDCHEGELKEAVKLVNLFLKAEEIGYIEKKGGTKEILSCKEEPELGKLPIVIWVNSGTLGPAELVGAVLKEFKKAKIIGLSTLGLAAQHNFFPLDDGSALVLTSGIFHLKSGKNLWKKGLTPDVKIKRKEPNDKSYIEKTLSLLPRM